MSNASLKSEFQKSSFKIATRGSELAIWQAKWVQNMILQKFPKISVELIIIKTTGDRILDKPLSKIGGKGLFLKELEKALLEEKVDIAVHSMKDVTSSLPEGLEISVIAKREYPADAWICPKFGSIDKFPKGGLVGTSSLRRQSQLKYHRPDLRFCNLRGNVQTRIRKLDEGIVQATILAEAGLKRIRLHDRISEILPMDYMLPAIGQGAIGIETRVGDEQTFDKIKHINDRITWDCLLAERSLLNSFQGNCQIPLAGHCFLKQNKLVLRSAIGDLEGKKLLRYESSSNRNKAIELGKKVAHYLLENGGKEILEKISNESN